MVDIDTVAVLRRAAERHDIDAAVNEQSAAKAVQMGEDELAENLLQGAADSRADSRVLRALADRWPAIKALAIAARDVADGAGVGFEDERIRYLTLQIDKTEWRELTELVGD